MSLEKFDSNPSSGGEINEPVVHIGLMQAFPEVLVNLHGDWAFLAGSEVPPRAGAYKSRRVKDAYLKFYRIPESRFSESYTVKLAEFLSTDLIFRWLPFVKKVGVDRQVSVVEAGRLWSFRGSTWDARTRWIVAGNYGNFDEAKEAAQEWDRQLEISLIDKQEASQMDRDLFWANPEPSGSAEPTGNVEVRIGDELCRNSLFRMEPLNENAYFSLFDVTIGKEFHWEHRKTLRFKGKLIVLGDRHGGITVVNVLPIESYLESVTSSEASSGAPDEYLKAQSIAARSTVLATVSRHHRADPFDLCAEDHCQCYYGLDQVDRRIPRLMKSTRGLVRVMGWRPTDCRYAKICGGKTENYPDVWGGEPIPYLISKPCGAGRAKETSSVEEFLEPNYGSFCNPRMHKYPATLEHAKNLFRWEQVWQANDLAARVEEVLGKSVGKIRDLRPITRGASGRITRLQVVGSEKDITVRGELIIRKLLSPSHLPSSLFIVETEGKGPEVIRLHGGGWGHGVGMCQLGGMAMAKSGSNFDRILDAYYPGTITDRLW